MDGGQVRNPILKTIRAKHEPYTNGHLGEVVVEMEQVGTPTLRVMNHDGELCATEGSHRLAAAYALGLVPKLVVEIPDTDDALTAHWDKIATALPTYDFDSVLVLDLNAFLEQAR